MGSNDDDGCGDGLSMSGGEQEEHGDFAVMKVYSNGIKGFGRRLRGAEAGFGSLH